MKISSDKTTEDWEHLLKLIHKNPEDYNLWESAFKFFEDRIRTRYIEPAETIARLEKYDGEGFSIVAILCSTIEALETFRTGKTYRKPTKGNELDQNKEYYKSQVIFESFLKDQSPFKVEFTSTLATDFYENVRCAILHEATTRNGWRIRVNTSKLILTNGNEKILNRNILLQYIKEYVQLYKIEFMNNKNIRENFIQKFNGICKVS